MEGLPMSENLEPTNPELDLETHNAKYGTQEYLRLTVERINVAGSAHLATAATIRAAKFDAVHVICKINHIWYDDDGDVNVASAMGKDISQIFATACQESGLLSAVSAVDQKAEKASLANLKVVAFLASPMCDAIVNEFDEESQSFLQDELYQEMLSVNASIVCKLAKGKLSVAQKGIKALASLTTSSGGTKEERVDKFLLAVKDTVYGEKPLHRDKLIASSTPFREIGKALKEGISTGHP
jgi:hypothetical protein